MPILHNNATHDSLTQRRGMKKRRLCDGSALTVIDGLEPGGGGIAPRVSMSNRRASPARSTVAEESSDIVETLNSQADFHEQALDERSKRRIRRRYLSEQTNLFEGDQRGLRRETKEKDAELQTNESEREVARTSPRTSQALDRAQTTTQIARVEEELCALKRHFSVTVPTLPQPHRCRDNSSWTDDSSDVRRGDTFQIYEDNTDPYDRQQQQSDEPQPNRGNQGGAVLVGSELGTARLDNHVNQGRTFSLSHQDQTFDTELSFVDSSPMSTSLINLERPVRTEPTTDASTYASVVALKNHLKSIRLSLKGPLPDEDIFSSDNSGLFCELMCKIKVLIHQFGSREAELRSLRQQKRTLKSSFDRALLGAEDASRRVTELENALKETATTSMQRRERAVELEQRINEKEKGMETLNATLDDFKGKCNRQATLLESIEADHQIAMQQVKAKESSALEQVDKLAAKVVAEENRRRKAEESADERLKRIQNLETSAHQVNECLEVVEQRKMSGADQFAARIASLSTALARADEEVEKLKGYSARLEEIYRGEVMQGEKTVDWINKELVDLTRRITTAKKARSRVSKTRSANGEKECHSTSASDSGAPVTTSTGATPLTK